MIITVYEKNIELTDIEIEILENAGISIDPGFFELVIDMNNIEKFPEIEKNYPFFLK